MRKQTVLKKRTAISAKTHGKTVALAPKKKTIRRPTKEKTVLTKLKDVLDDTAAKLRTLLPGENKNNRPENIEMA